MARRKRMAWSRSEKIAAVARVRKGEPLNDVADSIGASPNRIYDWKRKFSGIAAIQASNGARHAVSGDAALPDSPALDDLVVINDFLRSAFRLVVTGAIVEVRDELRELTKEAEKQHG